MKRTEKEIANAPSLLGMGNEIREQILQLFEAYVIARHQGRDRLAESSVLSYRTRATRIADFFAALNVRLEDADEVAVTKFLHSLKLAKTGWGRYLDLIDRLLVFEATRKAALTHEGKPPLANRVAFKVRNGENFKKLIKRQNAPDPQTLSDVHRNILVAWFQWPLLGRWTEHRNRAICALMLGAGLKPMQAFDLQLNDLFYRTEKDEQNHVAWKLRVCKTGNNPAHETLISDYAQQCLAEWITDAKEMGLISGDNDYIFPNSTNHEKLERTGFNRQFAAIVKELKLGKCKPHYLRNSWLLANIGRANAAERIEIQKYAGLQHKDSIKPYLNRIAEASKHKVI